MTSQQRHRGVLEVHTALRQHLCSLRDDARAVMADNRDGKRGHRGIVSPVDELQGNPIQNVGLADYQLRYIQARGRAGLNQRTSGDHISAPGVH